MIVPHAATSNKPIGAPSEDLTTELTVSAHNGVTSASHLADLCVPFLALWLEPEDDQRLDALAIMSGVRLSSGSLWLRPCGEERYAQHSRKWAVTL